MTADSQHVSPDAPRWSLRLRRIRPGLIAVTTNLLLMLGRSSLATEPQADPPVLFTDVTVAARIDFVETLGDREMSNIVEATGVGCGFVDYDGDGWMDIYLVNGCWLKGLSDPKVDSQERAKLALATDRLYRNRGDGTFEDVTVRAGLARPGYGMGVVAADYDTDGDTDIYVTNYGPNFLYRNNGDGTFSEVAKDAGVDDPRFSVGAVFFDYDRDGRLDLYVGNYLTYEPDLKRRHTVEGVRSPLAYDGQQDRLFRGNADGTFTDVTRRAGIEIQPVGRAMGVGAIDYDGDGLLDVFVSNDAMENFLLRNKGDGTFENEALLAGTAFGEAGDATAAMAVEVGDYDADGRFDILVPDMNRCCLYRNLGGGMFEDLAVRSGISARMTHSHGWGGVLADFDLDGYLDLYIANGSACRFEAHNDALFINNGRGRFIHIDSPSGSLAPSPRTRFVSRGVAQGDFDNDGDVDLLVANLNDRPVLLQNDTPRRGRHWLSVRLVGRSPNRDAIGAIVKISVGGHTLVRQRLSGGSYLSQHDSRIHFGLGRHGEVDRLEVIWPDRSRLTRKSVPPDRLITIRQQTVDEGKTR
ncbi:MAG: CRTAC1 family protein [Phycisphaerales bacterium]|nr:MAG: CRTAC1 family protein [Phycisphaerales bacterium]